MVVTEHLRANDQKIVGLLTKSERKPYSLLSHDQGVVGQQSGDDEDEIDMEDDDYDEDESDLTMKNKTI